MGMTKEDALKAGFTEEAADRMVRDGSLLITPDVWAAREPRFEGEWIDEQGHVREQRGHYEIEESAVSDEDLNRTCLAYIARIRENLDAVEDSLKVGAVRDIDSRILSNLLPAEMHTSDPYGC